MDLKYKTMRDIAYMNNIWDDVNLKSIEDLSNVSSQVINFFKSESQLIYPAKSFFVAIVYAACFEKFFNEDFYKMLNDDELLPDDKYFVPYHKAKETYDNIFSVINCNEVLSYVSTQKTVEYFKKEFLLCK